VRGRGRSVFGSVFRGHPGEFIGHARERVCATMSGSLPYEFIFKYIVIGDMGVGKSCLLHQFTENKCSLDLSFFGFLFPAAPPVCTSLIDVGDRALTLFLTQF
jgi:Ras family